MTSLERERRGAVRMGLVRERLLEHYARFFGAGRTSLFTDHPLLARLAPPGRVPVHHPATAGNASALA
jgi:hypothetical protein